MTISHKTLLISDLHLEESRPDITEQFFSLLQSCDASVDALYILGDLFEAWIGDDDDTSFHQSIIVALKAATDTGLTIYFMHGNRDFLIGKKFLRATGCQLLSDETVITLYGTPILLMHGDTLCTQDIAYLKWRKKARNPILHTLLFLILPLKFRRQFANKMRSKSAQHTHSASPTIMDVTTAEVVHVMEKHQVQCLIHGHTHRPAIHSLTIKQLPAERIVLAPWHERGNCLIWDMHGKKEFKTL